MTREDAIRRHVPSAGLCLEIGPSYNPILPKGMGYRVEIADHTDRPGLLAKYGKEPNVEVHRIEEVDHVITGSLFDAVAKPGHFDVIVASNVAEHTPDLVGFLLDCERLLKEDGQLVLINPDKRYCFDVFRSVSSTGQVLQAHLEKRTTHLPGTMFDHVAGLALRGGSAGWSSDDRGPLSLLHDPAAAYANMKSVQDAGGYLDCHAWAFTPTSFRLIVKDLADLGLIALREASLVPSVCWFEFLTVLSRSGEGCAEDRVTLCQRVIAEHGGIHVAAAASGYGGEKARRAG